jgi:hypothetical protein
LRPLAILLLPLALGCIHPRVVDDGKLNPVGLENVADETARLRQSPYLREIPSYAIQGADLKRFVKAELDLTADHLEAETALYRRLGVLKPDDTMRKMYERMYRGGTAIAGFYTWGSGGQLYVLEDYSFGVKLQLEMIGWITGTDWAYELALSHELVHALQDQHLDLAALMPPEMERHDGDRAWAARSVIESEANFWGWGHLHAVPLEGWLARRAHSAYIGFNYAPFHLVPQLAFPRVPPFFTRLSLGNYTRGLGWVIARLDEGGRARLAEALREEMPASTEQLLFPDEIDDPIALARLDLDDGEVILSDSFGALRLMTLLEPHLWLPGHARGIARAWGGDRVEVARFGEREVLLWRFVLDDERGAEQLMRAWPGFVRGRYGGRAELTSATVDEVRGSIGPREVIRVRRRGRSVVVVEGAEPARADHLLMRLEGAMAPVAPESYAAEALESEALKDSPDGVVRPTRGALPPPRTTVDVDKTGASRIVREQLHLPARTIAWRAGASWDFDRGALRSDLAELRWGIREGLELSLPLALSFHGAHGLGDSIVTVGFDGLGDRLGESHVFGTLGLTHALRLGGVAVAGQLLTSARWNTARFDDSQAAARLGVGGYVSPHPRLVLAAGAAWLADVDAAAQLAGEPVRAHTLEIGSALRRGGRFAQPLVEWEALDILRLYVDGAVALDLASGQPINRRLGGGFLLYF